MDKKIEILHKICEALFEELGDYSRKSRSLTICQLAILRPLTS